MSPKRIGVSAVPPSARSPFAPIRVDVHPAVVSDLHGLVHTKPQPDCLVCPPVACPCGAVRCPDAFDHRRGFAGAEATWMAVA